MSGGGGTTYDDNWIRAKNDEFTQHINNLGQYNEHRWLENVEQNKQLQALSSANQHRFDEHLLQEGQINTLRDDLTGYGDTLSGYGDSLSGYGTRLDDLEKLYGSGTGTGTSTIGDVSGLDAILTNLQSQYDSIDLGSYEGRMNQNLDALGETLRGEFGSQIQGLDLGNVRSAIESAQGDLSALTGQFSGLSTDVDALRDQLAAEYGGEIGDMSSAFEGQLADLKSELGGSIESLYGEDERLAAGLESLQSGANLTAEQLASLRDSFGDFQTQSASNLGDVRSALESEIGDLDRSLTSGLFDVRSEGLQALIGESQARQQGLSDAATARSDLASQLRGEAASSFTDVYRTREDALRDLSGRFGDQLRSQETEINRRLNETGQDIDDRIAQLGSMMNYRMLGDSAGGVAMRRSKAFKSGATGTGTSQLGRSMKLKTLNI